MTVLNMTIAQNEVVVGIRGRDTIRFIEADEYAAMRRFDKMMEDLPLLLEELMLSGAFEAQREEDML